MPTQHPPPPPLASSGAMTPPSTGSAAPHLAQDIVIEGTAADAQTGAQAIAPDHAPTMRRARDVGLAHAHDIAQFLYHQSELLDQQRWQDYIDLFADDGVYWMPVTPEQIDWQGQPSIFAEDKSMMRVRMGRVTHPTAWSQVPLWRTNHVVGNVVVESATASTWTVRSRFHMMELRRDTVRHFGGTYRHTLVDQDGEFKIRLQRVDMFNAQAPYDYVLQVWV